MGILLGLTEKTEMLIVTLIAFLLIIVIFLSYYVVLFLRAAKMDKQVESTDAVDSKEIESG